MCISEERNKTSPIHIGLLGTVHYFFKRKKTFPFTQPRFDSVTPNRENINQIIALATAS